MFWALLTLRLLSSSVFHLSLLNRARTMPVCCEPPAAAYFTQSTVDKLQTVDEVLPKPHAMIPEGLFRSARAGKIRRDTASSRIQQQQRQLSYYDHPDAAGPSGSSPVSAPYQTPAASYGPYGPPYAHMSPHAYSYSHATQSQYSPYVQDEGVVVHRQALAPPPSLPLPAGGPYVITPASRPSRSHSHPAAPPPPQSQSSISGHARGGVGLGLTYARPPREWDDAERQREREPREQMRYERDLERDRASISPQRIPSALPPLPNTFDPTRGRVLHPSASSCSSPSAAASAPPMQTRSPSYTPHPYANALQTHLARTSASGSQASVSEYYAPAKPIKPIDVSAAPQRTPVQSAASPTTPVPRASGTPGPSDSNKININYMDTDERNDDDPDADSNEDEGAEASEEIGEQRESAIGPARIGPSSSSHSHSPRHRDRLSLTVVRLSASPRSVPNSALGARSESVPRLRSVSFSGSAAPGDPVSISSLPSAEQVNQDSMDVAMNNRSPASASSKLSLDEERARSLVPLQNLENAVFPRRDPTDDALLRRFNALRTTPPNTARDE